ncbi:MAG: hypothetical protein AAGF24_12295 [Cyanobacteria bacterium P01_H01_bin.121]
MPVSLTLYDETTLGEKQPALVIDVLTETMTARELIRRRVYQEVKDYNTKQPEYLYSLVQPTDAEQTLNGYRLRKPRKINWEKQYDKAIEAFQHNGFILLVNDQQVEDLETEITLVPETTVSFLKLVPLVGG